MSATAQPGTADPNPPPLRSRFGDSPMAARSAWATPPAAPSTSAGSNWRGRSSAGSAITAAFAFRWAATAGLPVEAGPPRAISATTDFATTRENG